MIHGIFLRHPQSVEYQAKIDQLTSRLLIDSKRNKMHACWFSECWFAYEQEACFAKQSEEIVVLAWGRIDYQKELGQKLSLSSAVIQSLSTSEWILRAFLQYEDACTDHLIGDFSFVVYDARKKRLFLVRDHMGIKPLYYYQDTSIVAFSASLQLFHHLPAVSIKPRLQWASQFMLGLEMDFEKTAYDMVLKCPPAHSITVTADQMRKKQYFAFHTNKIYFKKSSDYVDHYRSQLEQAHKQRVQVDHPLGTELSGGIDSSTVTAFALQYYARSISDFHAFAFAHFQDEPKHILSISQHFCIPMTYVCCNHSEYLHDSNRVLTVLGAPSQHGNAIGHEIFFTKAEALGVRTLLSGFGGDEFVTSIHGYLYLHELLKQKKYKELYRTMRGNALTQFLRLLKFTYSHRRQRGVRCQEMAEAFSKRWPNFVVKLAIVDQYALKAQYDNAGQFDQGYQDLDQFTLEKRLQPFISTRTEECTLMAHHYGLEYRWPLLDVRLIQAFLSIPSSEKYHKGQGRYLHRRAIANKVPANIVAQNSKYMGERIAQPIPKNFTLNPNLHPAIFDVVDQHKLFHQEKQLIDHVTQKSSMLHHPSMRNARSNIQHVNALDHWLKHFYSKGWDWA